MSRPKIGVLYSGGIDSAALVGKLAKEGFEVWPVYMQCGLPWEKTEKRWAKKFLLALKSPYVKPLIMARAILEGAYVKNWSFTGKTPGAQSQDEEVFLPARNLLLILKALLTLTSEEISHLAIAILRGNPFSDATEKFFRNSETLLSDSFRRKIKLSAPFRKISKQALLRSATDLPLHLSFSCIAPQKGLHCGRCNKCEERRKAFHSAGLIDKTIYKNQRKR